MAHGPQTVPHSSPGPEDVGRGFIVKGPASRERPMRKQGAGPTLILHLRDEPWMNPRRIAVRDVESVYASRLGLTDLHVEVDSHENGEDKA